MDQNIICESTGCQWWTCRFWYCIANASSPRVTPSSRVSSMALRCAGRNSKPSGECTYWCAILEESTNRDPNLWNHSCFGGCPIVAPLVHLLLNSVTPKQQKMINNASATWSIFKKFNRVVAPLNFNNPTLFCVFPIFPHVCIKLFLWACSLFLSVNFLFYFEGQSLVWLSVF